MTRTPRHVALLLGLLLALAPGLADARLGGGSSMGSRGGRTWSAPPSTPTAPGAPRSMERSLTPQQNPNFAPGYGQAPGYRRPGLGFGGGFGAGLLGGLIGAGLGGLLLGHGFFGGVSGLGGFIGLLVQLFLLYLLLRWLFRLFANRDRPAFAGPTPSARSMAPPGAAAARPGGGLGGGAMGGGPVTLQPADFQAFEQTLYQLQAAWSAHDLATLQRLTTPEMASYFAEQLADQVSRGVRNQVTDVRLERGDLAEAWTENGRDYATVAMRFSMLDATYDQTGRLVDGSATERVSATELWTFVRSSDGRSPGGRWLLSAIQQTG